MSKQATVKSAMPVVVIPMAMVRALQPCEAGYAKARRLFGNSVPLTEESAVKLAESEIALHWIAEHLLNDNRRKTFDEKFAAYGDAENELENKLTNGYTINLSAVPVAEARLVAVRAKHRLTLAKLLLKLLQQELASA